MKKFLISALTAGVCCVFTVGCSEHSTVTKKEEVKTPGGKTTVTTEQKVEKTGDHKGDGNP